ncbi:mucin-associated surface protein (MASP), putative, partial [Trypanosoma cruzi marinkellei]
GAQSTAREDDENPGQPNSKELHKNPEPNNTNIASTTRDTASQKTKTATRRLLAT